MILSGQSWRRVWVGIAYLLAMTVAVSPLFWVSFPALVDYPNHMARMWVITHPTLPALAQNYTVHWRLLPNLAMDLVVPALVQIMPFEVAGRVFVALSLIVPLSGTIALRYALQGKAGLVPLLSLPFLYNSALLWGFLNYLFALGCALLVFAAWVATRRVRLLRRLPVFAAFAALIFVLHLFAFGIYGLLVAFYELGGWWRETPRRVSALIERGLAGLQFVPTLLLWYATLPPAAGDKIDFGDLGRKFYAWFAPVAFGFTPPSLPLITLLIALVLLVIGWYGRVIGLVPAMRWPLAAITLLAAFMPFSLHGSNFADYRLPVAIPFLLIAGLDLGPIRLPYAAIIALLVTALFGERIWATAEVWINTERRFDEFRRTAAAIPQGASVVAVAEKMPEDWRWPDTADKYLPKPDRQVLNHLALFTVIDRSAFVPTFFSTWTIVQPTERNGGRAPQDSATMRGQDLMAREEAACDSKYTCHWSDKYDYLIWLDYGAPPKPLPAHLEPLVRGSFFEIYRITHG